MQLVAPDILSDACGLSVGLIALAFVMGVALWLFGWRCHRFWIVLITTVLAGVYGLYDVAVFRAQPLMAAILLSLAGGLLALAVVRHVLAFIAGGLVGLLIVQGVFPSLDQAVCFLVAGLISLFLFRVSMMALTSLTGTIVMGYASLSMLNHYGSMDAVSWTSQGSGLLNWICGLVALLGFGIQYLSISAARGQGGATRKPRTPALGTFY